MADDKKKHDEEKKDKKHAQRDCDARAVVLKQRLVPAGVGDSGLIVRGHKERSQRARPLDA